MKSRFKANPYTTNWGHQKELEREVKIIFQIIIVLAINFRK